jgi:hypothetical protein
MSYGSIQSVVITWKTPYEESVWRRLEGIHGDGRTGDSNTESQDFLVVGPSLPTEGEPRVAELAVHRRQVEGLLHWRLSVRTAPRTEPPAEVRQRDAELGGQKGLATLLVDSMTSNVPPVAMFQIRYFVDASRHECKVLPVQLRRGDAHDIALGLGMEAWMEQVGYRFGGGANGLSEIVIVYLHREDVFAVSIHANGVLRPGDERWLPYADEMTELVRETFFTQQELGDEIDER